jgi:hypothetical protein
MPNREVIFELQSFGAITKVTAVDVQTGVEVSLQGPSNAGDHTLRLNALRKLEYVLKKRETPT